MVCRFQQICSLRNLLPQYLKNRQAPSNSRINQVQPRKQFPMTDDVKKPYFGGRLETLKTPDAFMPLPKWYTLLLDSSIAITIGLGIGYLKDDWPKGYVEVAVFVAALFWTGIKVLAIVLWLKRHPNPTMLYYDTASAYPTFLKDRTFTGPAVSESKTNVNAQYGKFAVSKASLSDNIPENWEVHETAELLPYWMPVWDEVYGGNGFRGTVLFADKSAPRRLYTIKASVPVDCKRVNHRINSIECVRVDCGQQFTVSEFAGMSLDSYLGLDVAVVVTARRKLQKIGELPSILFDFTILVSPETKAQLDSEQIEPCICDGVGCERCGGES